MAADESYPFAGFLTCDLAVSRCVRGRNLQPPNVWTSLVAEAG